MQTNWLTGSKQWLAGVATGLGLLAAAPAWAQVPATAPVVATVDEMLTKSQGVRYYDQYWVPLPGAAGAAGYEVLRRIDSVGLNWQLRRYVATPRQLVLEQFFTGPVPGVVFEGPSREWFPGGQLREEVSYHKGRLVGTLRTFYHNGRPHRTQSMRPSATACYDSTGRALPACPEYHTFARLRGKKTDSGRFLQLVQQQFPALLPPDYRPRAAQTVYYAFRIDPTGTVRDARLLTAAAPELETAILRAIAQLPAFEPAQLEGQPTNDVVEGAVLVKP